MKKVFQPSEHKEEALQLLRDGASEAEVLAQFPLSKRTVQRYAKEVADEKVHGPAGVEPPPGGTAGEKGNGQHQVRAPQQLAVVTSRAPGPIVFRMGELNIELNPQHLYDAFRYCEDIKVMMPAIDDDFSLMVKICCKNAWEKVAQAHAARLGLKIEAS